MWVEVSGFGVRHMEPLPRLGDPYPHQGRSWSCLLRKKCPIFGNLSGSFPGLVFLRLKPDSRPLCYVQEADAETAWLRSSLRFMGLSRVKIVAEAGSQDKRAVDLEEVKSQGSPCYLASGGRGSLSGREPVTKPPFSASDDKPHHCLTCRARKPSVCPPRPPRTQLPAHRSFLPATPTRARPPLTAAVPRLQPPHSANMPRVSGFVGEDGSQRS